MLCLFESKFWDSFQEAGMNPGIIMNRPYILCDILFSMIMVLDFTGTSTLYYITLLNPERVFQHPDHRFTKLVLSLC